MQLSPGTVTSVTAADHQGVLAFGDSITNGGGELQWGVALQSWVQWLSRGLGLPFTNYAADGARAADVITRQIPAHQRLNAVQQPRYELGCLYIGVNDVRAADWDPTHFERDFSSALAYLHGLCDRVLTVTIPEDLGRPRAGDPVQAANTVIERQVTKAGSLLLDLRDFRGREVMMSDHVHPTAMGQLAIAERALAVLERDGLPTRVAPRTFANPDDSPRARRGAFRTYAYRVVRQKAWTWLHARRIRRS